MARETLGFYRGDGGGNVENFRGFGQTHHIVFQSLAVYGLHTKSHLWLLINENKLAIVGIQ